MMNLTPHAIVVRTPAGDITYPPSGTIARVITRDVPCDPINGVPVIQRVMGDVTGLPAGDVPCLVSSMVLGAIPGRPNTFAPDTGNTAIRDTNGHIVAVTRFVAA